MIKRMDNRGRLAVCGGPPAVTLEQKAALAWPAVGPEDLAAIERVLLMEPYTFYEEEYRLSDEFAAMMGSTFALAHTNGTAAIHAALFAAGVGPGDEVIVPSYTFLATCTPAVALMARPVFAEISPDTLNLDPADVERRITPRTKAIVVVHLGGVPAEMEEITSVAGRYGVAVIEDASHAHGALYHGRHVGTIGDIGCFSLQASKLLPGMEAGMLLTDNREFYERAVALGHFEKLWRLPEDSPYRRYAETGMGFKYRIHPAAAAMARVRLRDLDRSNSQRNGIMDRLDSRINATEMFRTQSAPAESRRTYMAYRVMIRPEAASRISRAAILSALAAEGVQVAGSGYVLQHMQPLYEEASRNMAALTDDAFQPGPAWLPATEEVDGRIITLPVFHRDDTGLAEQYALAMEKVSQYWLEIPEGADVPEEKADRSRTLLR